MTMGTFAYIGTTEIGLIIGAIVLLFGGAKIPQLAKGLGEGIREFKKSMDGPSDTAKSTDAKAETEEKPGAA